MKKNTTRTRKTARVLITPINGMFRVTIELPIAIDHDLVLYHIYSSKGNAKRAAKAFCNSLDLSYTIESYE